MTRPLLLACLLAGLWPAAARAASFGTPVMLGPAAPGPALDVAPDGTAVVGWHEPGGRPLAVMRGADGRLGPRQDLTGPLAAGDGGNAAMGGVLDGGPAVAWGTVADGFGEPVPVSPGVAGGAPEVAFSGTLTLAAWVAGGEVSATWCSSELRTCLPGTELGAARPGFVRAAGTPAEGLVLWSGADGGLMLAALGSSDPAPDVRRLNEGLPAAADVSLETSADGRAVVAWGGGATTHAVVRDADGTLSPVRTLPFPRGRVGLTSDRPAVVLGEPDCGPFSCPTATELPAGPSVPLEGFADYTTGRLWSGPAALDPSGLLVWAPSMARDTAWIGDPDGSAGREEPLGSAAAGAALELDEVGGGLLAVTTAAGRLALLPYRSERGDLHSDQLPRLDLLRVRRSSVRFGLTGSARVRFAMSGGGRPVHWSVVADAGRRTSRLPRRARRRFRSARILQAEAFDHLGRPGSRVRFDLHWPR